MIKIPQDGILLVNKPIGPTSHDMVDRIRKLTGVKRVGHAGTLDPFAQGLLIILIGPTATKRQKEFLVMNKTYKAVFCLGAKSSTDDPTGAITFVSTAQPLEPLKVQEVVRSFIGTFDQQPPKYSAKKIKGEKAYVLARKGLAFTLQSKQVEIIDISILEYVWPFLFIDTTVSSGTYIRALARDIGEKLGCGAYCKKLIRTRIGNYSLDEAIVV